MDSIWVFQYKNLIALFTSPLKIDFCAHQKNISQKWLCNYPKSSPSIWFFHIFENDLDNRSGFPGSSDDKESACMLETQVQSLGWEYPLEKEMATHSSILAWKIPWMEEPGRLQSMGLQRVGHDWATSLSPFVFLVIGYYYPNKRKM